MKTEQHRSLLPLPGKPPCIASFSRVFVSPKAESKLYLNKKVRILKITYYLFNSIVSSIKRETETSKAKYLPFACIVKSFPSLSVTFVDVFCLTLFYITFLCVENGLYFHNGFNHSDHVRCTWLDPCLGC